MTLACAALWILLSTVFNGNGGFIRQELGRYESETACAEAAEKVEGLARCERRAMLEWSTR